MSELELKLNGVDTISKNAMAVQFLFHASARAKKDKIVVLSPGGFSDNSKYMFSYLMQNIRKYRENVDIVWVCHNDNEAKLLQAVGAKAIAYKAEGEVLKTLIEAKICLRSTHHLARADYCFLQPALSGAINIQMWHGIPAKKVAYQLTGNRKSAWDFSYFASDCLSSDYVLAESEYVAPRYQVAFPNASLIINGSPRTDCLIGDAPNNPFFYLNTNFSHIQSMINFREKGGRVALYAPTFREAGQDRASFFSGVRQFLMKVSQDPDIMVVLKNHKVSKDEEELRRIVDEIASPRVLMPKSADDIYPYLREASVLVTDYSSTYYDYLLTGGDIVFFQPDLKEYTQKREIYDEEALSSVALGVKVFDGAAAAAAIKDPQSTEIRANREALTEKMFALRDGRSSERLADRMFSEMWV